MQSHTPATSSQSDTNKPFILTTFHSYKDLIKQGNFKEALKEFSFLPDLHIHIADQLISNGDFITAHQSLCNALKLNPVDRLIQLKRATLFLKNQKYFENNSTAAEYARFRDTCNKDFSQGNKITPNEKAILKSYEAEMRVYSHTTSISAQDLEKSGWHYFLGLNAGTLWGAEPDPQKKDVYLRIAMFNYEEAVLANTNNIVAWNHLALVYYNFGMHEPAKELIKRLVNLFNHPISHIFYGAIMVGTRDLDNLKAACVAAVKLAQPIHFGMLDEYHSFIIEVLEDPQYSGPLIMAQDNSLPEFKKCCQKLHQANTNIREKPRNAPRSHLYAARAEFHFKLISYLTPNSEAHHFHYAAADADYAMAIWLAKFENKDAKSQEYLQMRASITLSKPAPLPASNSTPTDVAISITQDIPPVFNQPLSDEPQFMISPNYRTYRERFLQGMSYLQDDVLDLPRAKRLFSDLIKSHPALPDGHIGLGFYAMKCKDFPLALTSFTNAHNINPHDQDLIETYLRVIPKNNQLYDDIKKTQVVIKKSYQDFEKAHLLYLAKVFKKSGLVSIRMSAVIQANETSSSYEEASTQFAYLATTAKQLKNNILARYYLELAIAKFPLDVYALFELACQSMAMGDSKAAAPIFDHLVDNFHFLSALGMRGYLHSHQADLASQQHALRDITVFLQHGEDENYECFITNEKILLQLVKCVTNISYSATSKQLSSREAKNKENKIQEAEKFFTQGQYFQIIHIFNELLQKLPINAIASVISSRANVYFSVGNYIKAVQDSALAFILAKYNKNAEQINQYAAELTVMKRFLKELSINPSKSNFDTFRCYYRSEFFRYKLSEGVHAHVVAEEYAKCKVDLTYQGFKAHNQAELDTAMDFFQQALAAYANDFIAETGLLLCLVEKYYHDPKNQALIPTIHQHFDSVISKSGYAHAHYLRAQFYIVTNNIAAAKADLLRFCINASKHDIHQLKPDVKSIRILTDIYDAPQSEDDFEIQPAKMEHALELEINELFKLKQWDTAIGRMRAELHNNLGAEKIYCMLASAYSSIDTDQALLYSSLAIWFAQDLNRYTNYLFRSKLYLRCGNLRAAFNDLNSYNSIFTVPFLPAQSWQDAQQYLDKWIVDLLKILTSNLETSSLQALEALEYGAMYMDHVSPDIFTQVTNLMNSLTATIATNKLASAAIPVQAPPDDNEFKAQRAAEHQQRLDAERKQRELDKQAKQQQLAAQRAAAAAIRAQQLKDQQDRKEKLRQEKLAAKLQAEKDDAEAARILAEEKKQAAEARKAADLRRAEQRREKKKAKKKNVGAQPAEAVTPSPDETLTSPSTTPTTDSISPSSSSSTTPLEAAKPVNEIAETTVDNIIIPTPIEPRVTTPTTALEEAKPVTEETLALTTRKTPLTIEITESNVDNIIIATPIESRVTTKQADVTTILRIKPAVARTAQPVRATSSQPDPHPYPFSVKQFFPHKISLYPIEYNFFLYLESLKNSGASQRLYKAYMLNSDSVTDRALQVFQQNLTTANAISPSTGLQQMLSNPIFTTLAQRLNNAYLLPTDFYTEAPWQLVHQYFVQIQAVPLPQLTTSDNLSYWVNGTQVNVHFMASLVDLEKGRPFGYFMSLAANARGELKDFSGHAINNLIAGKLQTFGLAKKIFYDFPASMLAAIYQENTRGLRIPTAELNYNIYRLTTLTPGELSMALEKLLTAPYIYTNFDKLLEYNVFDYIISSGTTAALRSDKWLEDKLVLFNNHAGATLGQIFAACTVNLVMRKFSKSQIEAMTSADINAHCMAFVNEIPLLQYENTKTPFYFLEFIIERAATLRFNLRPLQPVYQPNNYSPTFFTFVPQAAPLLTQEQMLYQQQIAMGGYQPQFYVDPTQQLQATPTADPVYYTNLDPTQLRR